MASRSGDCGIFVSKIKDGGAAQVDGILEVGDRILEVGSVYSSPSINFLLTLPQQPLLLQINSTKLENVQHAFAVQAFLDAGDDVRLIIQKKGPLRKVHRFGFSWK